MFCLLALAAARLKFSEHSYIHKPLTPHEQPSADGPAQEKTCSTIGVGLDILEQISKKIVEQYIEKFNDNQYKNIQDYEVHPLIGNYTVRMQPHQHEFATKISDDGRIKLSLEQPVSLSGEHRAEKWSHTFTGKSKMQFEIGVQKVNNTWQLEAHTDKAFTKVYQEGQACQKMPESECKRIFEQLDSDLHYMTFPYGFRRPEANFFYNQPTAIRTLLGFMAQLNHHFNASETHYAWLDDKVLGFNIGCTKGEVKEILDGALKAEMHANELYLSSQGNVFGSLLSKLLRSELAVSLNITDKDYEIQPFLPRTLERQETLKVFSIPANASTSFIRVEKNKHPEAHDQLVLFESNPSFFWDVNLSIMQKFFRFNFSSSVIQVDKYVNKYSPYKSTVVDDDTVVRLFGQHKSTWLDEVTVKGVVWFQVDDDLDQPAWMRRRARQIFIEKQQDDDDDEEEEGPPEDIGEEVAQKPNYNYLDLTTELHPSHLKNKSLLNVTRDEEDEEEDDYEEGEMPEIDDYLIIQPVEFEIRFLYQERRGMSTIFGFTQEIKTKAIDDDEYFNITLKDCFLAPNPKYNETLGEAPKYIDSEVCNKTKEINTKHLKAQLRPEIEKAFKLRESMAARNDYFPVGAIDYSFQLLCSGLEMKQPQFGFEQIENGKNDSRMVLRVPFNHKALDIGAFCDTYEPHMAQVDPRQIRQNRTKFLQIEQYMKNIQDNLTATESIQHLNEKFQDGFEGYWPKEHRDIKVISPLVHLLSSYFPLREWCRTNHKTWNPDRCAVFYSFFHDHVAFDDYGESRNGSQADCKIQVYYNFHQQYAWLSALIEYCLWAAGYLVLLIGIGMSSTTKALSCNQMVAIAFIGNVVLHLPSLLKVNYRQGIDYSAYINQAGCVVAGETRYNRISSLQGPCFYPAGHLWVFVPAYLLHIYTESAEYIVKFVFFLLHSTNMALVTKIAYAYFRHNPERAQLVSFMLLANMMDREFVQMQFNDNVLALCMTAMIYFVVVGRPLLASAMFSFGLSIKAGALLILPAFLGVVQYRFGLLTLLQVFIVAFAVQYVLGFLFLMRDTDAYILDSRLFGHGPGKQDLVGAKFENSVYWTFISRELYYSQEFNNQLKVGMVALNVFYFFVRQNCLTQCVLNIFAPLAPRSVGADNSIKTVPRMVVGGVGAGFYKFYHALESWALQRWYLGTSKDETLKMQKSVEILIFGFLVGASMIPGGHRQFMLWYINLIPLSIEMLGLPWWLTAWWYQLVWPVDICSFDDRWIHQFLTFFIVGWLMTVGAKRRVESASGRQRPPSKKVKVQ